MKSPSFFYWKILWLMAISLSVFCHKALAQFSSFRSFSLTDGLPQPYVYSITQDTAGYLWAGTGDGLSRFDGLHFETFDTDDGLAENFVTAAFRDNNGNLWFGHYQGAISMLTPGADTFSIVHQSEATNSRINKIIQDEVGNIWFLPQNKGLLRYDQEGNISTLPFTQGKAFFSFALVEDQHFLVGSQSGLWLLALKGNRLEKVQHYAALRGVSVRSVEYWEEEDIYLIGTQGKGLWGMKPGQQPQQLVSPNVLSGNISSLQPHPSRVWVGTRANGVFLIERQDGQTLFQVKRHYLPAQGLNNPYVLNLYTDREDNTWIGTNGGGLYQFKGQRFTRVSLPFENEHITALANISQKDWLIGTEAQGLFRVELTPQMQAINPQQIRGTNFGTPISSIFFQEKTNTTWVGIEQQGLFLMRDGQELIPFSQFSAGFPAKNINRIVQGSDGDIWVGSRLHGLFRIEPETYQFEQYNTLNGLMHNNVSDIHEDSKRRMWIVTSGGLCYIAKGYINYVENLPGTQNLTFNCVAEDRQGNIWFGSDGDGLFMYNNAVFKNYQTRHGLLSNYVYSAVPSKNGIWFISRNGLSLYETVKGGFKTYGIDSNMGELEIGQHAFFQDTDKKIWLGTNDDLLVYDPAQDTKNQIPPKISITRFYIFDQQAEIEEGKKLPFREYRMRFDFKALSLRNPEKTRYQYKLEGYDPEWSVLSSDTSVRFPNVDDGTYTFLVRAVNEDGVWSPTPDSFAFVVGKPIWKKWWFYAILVSVVGTGFYVYYRWKMRNLMQMNTTLENKVTERTQDLEKANVKLEKQKAEIENAYYKLIDLEAFKDSMTNMIVHDLKNPLNSVIALSDQNPSVRQAGQQMLNMIMNILDVHKLEEATLKLNKEKYPIHLVIEDALNQVALLIHEKGLTLHKNIDTSLLAYIDYELMVRVVVNLLTNSIKYTPAGGRIEVKTRLVEEGEKYWAVVSVIDNGPGIEKAFQHAIFDKYKQIEQKHSGITPSTGLGLTFCKLAVEAHDGLIDVISEKGKGSEFYFKIEPHESPKTMETVKTSPHIKQETIGNVAIRLTEADKGNMKSFIEQMKSLDIYDTSENISLIAHIPDKNEEVSKWKKEMELAVFAFNQTRYRELLDLVLD